MKVYQYLMAMGAIHLINKEKRVIDGKEVLEKKNIADYKKDKNGNYLLDKNGEKIPFYGFKDGSTYIWEVEEHIADVYKIGKKFIFNDRCENQTEQLNQTPVTNGKWHDPVDKPQINKYNFGGNNSPRSACFGNTRINDGLRFHGGIDLFGIPEKTKVYASLDCKFIGKDTSGNLTLEIINTKDLINQKELVNYHQLMFPKNNEYFAGIQTASGPPRGEEVDFILTESDKIYFAYSHMFKIFDKKDIINEDGIIQAGTHIGYVGVRGNAEGTRAPHLHFEVRNMSHTLKNKMIRLNPALFLKLNDYNTKEQDNASKTKWKTPK